MSALNAATHDAGGTATETALGALSCALDVSGALYLPDERALVVADLHLEKGSSRAMRGVFLPPYDTRATLACLAAVLARYAPRTVVALGDSFHDRQGPDRLPADDRAALAGLQAGRRWIWVAGNHDPALPEAVGGEVMDGVVLGDVSLRHEPGGGGEAEIAGHLHPVAKVNLRGRSVRRRCFVSDAQRLVLPAFGAYAGGLNIRDRAFTALFPLGFTAHVIGTERLYAIARPLLSPD